MNGSLPPRERGQETQNIIQIIPNILAGFYEQERLCRETRKQAGAWARYMSASTFDKSTILSAGNSWAQADAFGTGEQRKTHISYICCNGNFL